MQYLIESDVLLAYLRHSGPEPSVLRRALSVGTCYTTMLNAMELFAEMTAPHERVAVTNMLMVVRVLGFNSRFAEPFADLAKGSPGITQREMLVLGMAKASKLTVLTEEHFGRYTALGAVPVVSTPEAVPANIS